MFSPIESCSTQSFHGKKFETISSFSVHPSEESQQTKIITEDFQPICSCNNHHASEQVLNRQLKDIKLVRRLYPKIHREVTLPSKKSFKLPIYRCKILSEKNSIYHEIVRTYGEMPPLLEKEEIFKRINTNNNFNSNYKIKVLIFSVLDETGEPSETLGYLILHGTWFLEGDLDDVIVHLIGNFEYELESDKEEIPNSYNQTTLNVNTNKRQFCSKCNRVDQNFDKLNSNQEENEIRYMTPYFFMPDCNENNMIIYNPDLLISCSKIANGIQCKRRPFFEIMFQRGKGLTNKSAFIGTLLHEVVEKLLIQKRFSFKNFKEEINNFLIKNKVQILVNRLDSQYIEEKTISMYESIESWCRDYLPSDFRVDIDEIEFLQLSQNNEEKKTKHTLIDIEDVEEMLWSTTYGIKGKVDITCKSNYDNYEVLYPLEMKSSKYNEYYSSQHKLQLNLYILMMSDLYCNSLLNSGSLLFLDGGKPLEVFTDYMNGNEFKSILKIRNNIANALSNRNFLDNHPSEYLCAKCPVKSACMIYTRTVEDIQYNNLIFQRETSLINTEKDIKFLKKWLQFIDLEYPNIIPSKNLLWNQQSSNKEKTHGTCIAELEIDNEIEKDSLYIYTFIRKNKSIDELCFELNDRVVVSSNDTKWVHLAIGIVIKLKKYSITIQSDTKIRRKNLNLFRIDIYERELYSSSLRSNIIQLYIGENTVTNPFEIYSQENTISNNSVTSISPHQIENKKKLRSLIVNHDQPKFSKLTDELSLMIDSSKIPLNSDQRNAIEHILTCEDYTLIHGLPGTGKTSTIAAVIDILVRNLKKRVLVSSYTHAALDNMMKRIIETSNEDYRIFRMNTTNHSIDPSVIRYVKDEEYFVENNIKDQEYGYVIGCTAASAGSSLILEDINFDYCFIDEAGQILTPAILGPLRHCRKFILIGDPEQLPPLVTKLIEGNSNVNKSLLCELSELFPIAKCELRKQYRMNSTIMKLPNSLIYNGKMTCATKEIEKFKLKIQFPLVSSNPPKWLQDTLNPEHSIVFINTDLLGDELEKTDRKIDSVHNTFYNEEEIAIINLIVQNAINHQLNSNSIGVISPYNYHVKRLKECFDNQNIKDVYIETIDRSQGIEKSLIILSLVRHNPKGDISSIMKNEKRLNVAITRAKHKIIIIGSHSTHVKVDMWSHLFKLISENGKWIDFQHRSHPLTKISEIESKPTMKNIGHIHFPSQYLEKTLDIIYEKDHLRKSIKRKLNSNSHNQNSKQKNKKRRKDIIYMNPNDSLNS